MGTNLMSSVVMEDPVPLLVRATGPDPAIILFLLEVALELLRDCHLRPAVEVCHCLIIALAWLPI